MDFEELKRLSQSGEVQRRLNQHLRFNVGARKEGKLVAALRFECDKSILDNDVSRQHADRLYEQFDARWGNLEPEKWQTRLRMCTVLDRLVELDETTILECVESMRNALLKTFSKVRGIHVIGVAEIEIVSLGKMRELVTEADEARKLEVCESLQIIGGRKTKGLGKEWARRDGESFALVHFHGIIDFGYNSDKKIRAMSELLRSRWPNSYCVELKRLHTDKTIRENLKNLAGYFVKGGNENLIYKTGLGYDSADMLQKKMIQRGRESSNDELDKFENELSLTYEEIRILGEAYYDLMRRKGSSHQNGYLIKHGQPLKYVGS